MNASEVAKDPVEGGRRTEWVTWLSAALSSGTKGGVAPTGVGPVSQQQHADGLQVDVVHLLV